MTGPRNRVVCAGLVVALFGWGVPAWAQVPRMEIAVGGRLTGSVAAGSANADLLDSSGGTLALFRTTNRIAAGWGLAGLVSMKIRERLRAELELGWGAADFESRIFSDVEDVPAVTATQKVSQFTADISLAWRVMERGRVAVFVRGGGGVLREITGDRALVDNGWIASAGGGTQVRLRDRPGGWFGHIAVRADARLQARQGGIAFGNSGRHVSPVLFAGVIFGQ